MIPGIKFFHKSPNKATSNHRTKLPQITEQNRLKSPKNFNFLWWFAIK